MRAAEARMRAIIDSAIDAIVTVGRDGRVVEFNPAAERTFHRRREEVMGESAIALLVPAHVRETVERELKRCAEAGQSPVIGHFVEVPGLRADGTEFPAEVAVTVTASATGERLVTAFVRDITERVEAEAALQRQMDERQAVHHLSEAVSRARSLEEINAIALDALQRLLGADRASVLLFDDEGVMRFVAWRNLSDAYRAMAEGHSPWPATATRPEPLLVPSVETEESLDELRDRILAEGIRSLAFIPLVAESRLLGKFMVYYDRPHEYTKNEIRLAETIANHVAFTIEHRRRGLSLEQQQAFLRNVLDLNPSLIFAKDRAGRFTLANRVVADMYGTTVENLLGRTDADFNPNADEVQHFRSIDLKVMETLVDDAREETVTAASGETHWLFTVKKPIVGADGRATHVLGVAIDISERKRTEQELLRHREHLEELVANRTRELEHSHQQLRQSERMAMIGTLSTGLGHDMGNLLLPLRVRLDAMEARGLPNDFQDDLRAIRTFVEYLQRLSNGLRLLAHDPHEPGHSRDTTDLCEWWPDVEPVLKNSLPGRIPLEGDFVRPLPRARIAKHVLTQVVFNIVQNAGEAMQDQGNGKVTVWAEEEEDGNFIRIAIADTGPGMTPDVAQRCMEPFFTTKARAISTGLGLALVHGLVQQAGGRVDIETALGRGTTFILHFAAEPAGEPHTDMDARRPRAMVSLQDARMRSHMTSVLRSLGFEVEAGERPATPDVEVWVADAGPRALRLVREFASAGEHKHAIVLGAVPSGADFNRVVELPERPKPSEIWRAARAIAERFQFERKDLES